MRGGGARSLSLTEDPRLPKAFKGPREAKGVEGARPPSLTKDPRLPKASEGSQGFLRPQEGPRGQGEVRGWGSKAPESD